ncbi:bifunctional transcriptional activator/DNA repair enzyme Ada [Drosophila bipectinata]|uniref:bifunctional transcriptional activator/DNA repair enzyme Ada n=1 Tax=Drosophila bipectinata TaxID=42026 RepID=UPI001C88ECB7|nr:bifunctional transcriptional activator/DNA repair enzyme Ada [Drosophila bipectinata]
MWFIEQSRIRLIPLPNPPKEMYFCFLNTKFGRMILGTVLVQKEPAICLLYFVVKSDKETLDEVQKRWPKSQLLRDDYANEDLVEKLFEGEKENLDEIPVAVLGTDFQRAVWSALIGLKSGQSCTYSQLAERVDNPKAIRPVASAVARNEVAILIPCHRIVSQNGCSKYRWGGARKQQILRYEKSIK